MTHFLFYGTLRKFVMAVPFAMLCSTEKPANKLISTPATRPYIKYEGKKLKPILIVISLILLIGFGVGLSWGITLIRKI